MFTFDFPPFSPFVCQTLFDKNTINQEVDMAYGKVYSCECTKLKLISVPPATSSYLEQSKVPLNLYFCAQ